MPALQRLFAACTMALSLTAGAVAQAPDGQRPIFTEKQILAIDRVLARASERVSAALEAQPDFAKQLNADIARFRELKDDKSRNAFAEEFQARHGDAYRSVLAKAGIDLTVYGEEIVKIANADLPPGFGGWIQPKYIQPPIFLTIREADPRLLPRQPPNVTPVKPYAPLDPGALVFSPRYGTNPDGLGRCRSARGALSHGPTWLLAGASAGPGGLRGSAQNFCQLGGSLQSDLAGIPYVNAQLGATARINGTVSTGQQDASFCRVDAALFAPNGGNLVRLTRVYVALPGMIATFSESTPLSTSGPAAPGRTLGAWADSEVTLTEDGRASCEAHIEGLVIEYQEP